MSNGRTSACGLGALALAAGLAVALGETAADTLVTVALAAAGALVAGGIGVACLFALRRRSLRAQAAAVALTSVGAVAAGAAASAAVMFLSSHDFRVLLVILVAAGAVGVPTAVVAADRLSAGSRALGRLVRTMGGDEVATGATPPLARELAELRGELEATAARLTDAQARERALEASRRELVAWVSHDLRTPLAAIRAMAEALEDGVVDDAGTVARYHRTIRVETDRLTGLVDDLFELSLIQAGALPLDVGPVSLADLISDTLAGAAPAAAAKGVRLEGAIEGMPPEVDLSAPEVMRVLRNLLDNAIRHTPHAGQVRLEAAVEGDHAVVSVTDACGGIPADDLDRVFDVAYRGDPARTPDDGGAGLGLAIARGLVDAHRGDIGVRNEGTGCRFTVRLPLSVTPAW